MDLKLTFLQFYHVPVSFQIQYFIFIYLFLNSLFSHISWLHFRLLPSHIECLIKLNAMREDWKQEEATTGTANEEEKLFIYLPFCSFLLSETAFKWSHTCSEAQKRHRVSHFSLALLHFSLLSTRSHIILLTNQLVRLRFVDANMCRRNCKPINSLLIANAGLGRTLTMNKPFPSLTMKLLKEISGKLKADKSLLTSLISERRHWRHLLSRRLLIAH